jgi:hypothetical protein
VTDAIWVADAAAEARRRIKEALMRRDLLQLVSGSQPPRCSLLTHQLTTYPTIVAEVARNLAFLLRELEFDVIVIAEQGLGGLAQEVAIMHQRQGGAELRCARLVLSPSDHQDQVDSGVALGVISGRRILLMLEDAAAYVAQAGLNSLKDLLRSRKAAVAGVVTFNGRDATGGNLMLAGVEVPSINVIAAITAE